MAINGDFDACQALVKQAFDDAELRQQIGLNSANSINISRLMAQICYYFEAAAQMSKAERENLVISVPSGNFGNLTAGLLAKALGLPVKRFIAATNANDTVPRYLETGRGNQTHGSNNVKCDGCEPTEQLAAYRRALPTYGWA